MSYKINNGSRLSETHAHYSKGAGVARAVTRYSGKRPNSIATSARVQTPQSDLLTVKQSIIRTTPNLLQLSEPKGEDLSLSKLTEMIQKQQRARRRIEDRLYTCEECYGFRSTLIKSNELLSSFVKENWTHSKEKLNFLSKIVEMENDLFRNINHQAVIIDTYKNHIKKTKEAQENHEKTAKENLKLVSEIEGLKAMFRAKSDSKIDSNYHKNLRIWKKEKSELENKLKEVYKELEAAKEHSQKQESPNQMLQLAKEFQQKKYELRGIITKLQFELGNAKESNIEKDKIIADLREKINITYHVYFEEEKKELTAVFNERLNMQMEEIHVLVNYRDAYFNRLQLLNKLQERIVYYEEAEKLAIARQNLKTDNIINLSDPIFSMFTRKPYTHLNKNHRKSITTFPDFSVYRVNKPSFAGFIEVPRTKNFQYKPIFHQWLEVTIRAVLDSKFAEHTLLNFDSCGQPSAFPEFVYDWLGKFYVDEHTRSVNEVEWWKKEYTEENKLMILAALSENQIQSKKIWEIYTFKEMLNETICLDELGFFLHCRFLIFEGPQLAHHQGKFSQFHYVTLRKVYNAVDKVMTTLAYDTMQELKSALNQRAMLADNQLVIESSFTLRVLLEYYRFEKQHKIESLSHAYNSCFSADHSLTFANFSQILRSLDKDISDGELAKTYRQAHAFGNSKITFDALITALSENGVFYRHLRLQGLKSKPNFHGKELTPSDKMHDVMKEWKQSKKDFIMIKEACVELGIPVACSILNRLESLMSHASENPAEDYGIWDLSDVSSHYWMSVIKIFSVFYETGILTKPEGWEVHFNNESRVLIKSLKEKKLEELKVSNAARKIQVWYRKGKNAVEAAVSVAHKLKLKKPRKK